MCVGGRGGDAGEQWDTGLVRVQCGVQYEGKVQYGWKVQQGRRVQYDRRGYKMARAS